MAKPRKPQTAPDQPFTALKVGYAIYRLSWRSRDFTEQARFNGFCHSDRLLIDFFEGMPPSRGAAVILHEIVHAAHDLAGINDGVIPTTEEHLTEIQSSALSTVLADNAEFMHWLIDAFHSDASTIREAWEKRK